MSGDGSTQLAFGDSSVGVYISADAGATWTNRNPTPPHLTSWQNAALSADGVHITMVKYFTGSIYTSADSGVTWTSRAPSKTFTDIAMSSDGSQQTAVTDGVSGGGDNIWRSSDSGATWTEVTGTTASWNCVAMSDDGVKQVAATYSANIWYSADAGATWTEVTGLERGVGYSGPTPIPHWAGLSASSDGSRIVANAYQENIWYSVDSGKLHPRPQASTPTALPPTLGPGPSAPSLCRDAKQALCHAPPLVTRSHLDRRNTDQRRQKLDRHRNEFRRLPHGSDG